MEPTPGVPHSMSRAQTNVTNTVLNQQYVSTSVISSCTANNQFPTQNIRTATDTVKPKPKRKRKKKKDSGQEEPEAPLLPNQQWVQEQLTLAQNQPLVVTPIPAIPSGSDASVPATSQLAGRAYVTEHSPGRTMSNLHSPGINHISTLASINKSMAMTDINQVIASATSIASQSQLQTSVTDSASVSRLGTALQKEHAKQRPMSSPNTISPSISAILNSKQQKAFPKNDSVNVPKPFTNENVFSLQEPNKLSQKFDELFSSVLNSGDGSDTVPRHPVPTPAKSAAGLAFAQEAQRMLQNKLVSSSRGVESAMEQSQFSTAAMAGAVPNQQLVADATRQLVREKLVAASGCRGSTPVTVQNTWNTKSSNVIAEVGKESFKVDMNALQVKKLLCGTDSDLVERLKNNQQEQIPNCQCLGDCKFVSFAFTNLYTRNCL